MLCADTVHKEHAFSYERDPGDFLQAGVQARGSRPCSSVAHFFL